MNYLAHQALSFPDELLMVGNFIADHLKARPQTNLPSEIKEGVKMHRFIDSFTDNHMEVKVCKKMFYPAVGKYAGVLVDILFDHFLAKNWARWNKENITLTQFSNHVYALMNRHKTFLPEKSALMLQYMEKQDWLSNYAQLNGLTMALNGLSKRTKFEVDLTAGIPILLTENDQIDSIFNSFYADLHLELKGTLWVKA